MPICLSELPGLDVRVSADGTWHGVWRMIGVDHRFRLAIPPPGEAAGGQRVEVHAMPEHGMATIWDADVLIWAASQIVDAANHGLRTSRFLRFTPYQMLVAIDRATGAREYRLLKGALARLQSTVTHRTQWRNLLRDHAAKLTSVPVDEVDTDLVLDVLRPIWLAKAETAGRVRGRIEKILDAAKARGLRPRDALNPAALRGHMALLLPRQGGMVRGHHKALPYADMPAFMVRLRTRDALAARCLEFTILTAARSGEALQASWGEIDLNQRLWTVPAERMKAGKEHVVPLSAPAVALLSALLTDDTKPVDRIFAINGATPSNMTMLLRRMGADNATVHGFRSTFRDWAGDQTSVAREIVEAALAHTISNKAERAYRRGTALERRRELMDAWAGYLG